LRGRRYGSRRGPYMKKRIGQTMRSEGRRRRGRDEKRHDEGKTSR